MMTSSNGIISALLAVCARNSPVTGEFPAQRPVTQSFGVFFDLRLNKRLSKQWRGWWFETPSRPLWRHCNDDPIFIDESSPRLRLKLQGLYSLSGQTSYRKISWSLEAAWLDIITITSLWHFTGISAAALPRCLSKFQSDWKSLNPNLVTSILLEILRQDARLLGE